MIPASLLARPTLIVGGVLVGLALLWGGWHYLRAERAEKALLEYQASAAAVISQRLVENVELERRQAEQLKEVSSGYENRLGTLRARYDRLRQSSNSGGGPVPQAAGGQWGGVDATAGSGQFPRCVAEDRRAELLDLLQLADTCAERLKACQSAWR